MSGIEHKNYTFTEEGRSERAYLVRFERQSAVYFTLFCAFCLIG